VKTLDSFLITTSIAWVGIVNVTVYTLLSHGSI
jgi:hypothetical protein